MANRLVKVFLAGEQVFPQTVAESVLVNDGTVFTLDKVLKKKVEQVNTPEGSGLVSSKDGTIITLSHQNKVTPNETPEAKLIQYDSTGHIVLIKDMNKQVVTVNSDVYTTYNGNTDSVVSFGDDFKIDESNNISLTWGGNKLNNYGIT